MANWLARAQAVLPAVTYHQPQRSKVTATSAEANDFMPDPLSARRHWLIHFPNLTPVEVVFTPPVTLAEALAAFPGATSADQIHDSPRHAATQADRAELAKLIAMVLPGDADGQQEAMTVALADVDNALICYRALAKEMSP